MGGRLPGYFNRRFFGGEGSRFHLNQLLQKFSPAEVLAPKPLKASFQAVLTLN